MQFIYLLPGWEGSVGDSRVLRDAVARGNGFKVPQGMVSFSLTEAYTYLVHKSVYVE